MRVLMFLAATAAPASALDIQRLQQFPIEAQLMATAATLDTLRAWALDRGDAAIDTCATGRLSYGEVYGITMAGLKKEQAESLLGALVNALEDFCETDLSRYRPSLN